MQPLTIRPPGQLPIYILVVFSSLPPVFFGLLAVGFIAFFAPLVVACLFVGYRVVQGDRAVRGRSYVSDAEGIHLTHSGSWWAS